MRPSDWAWLTLAVGVLAWDACCPPGEMLSEASVRYLRAHPIIWPVIVGYTAGHLLRVWPERWSRSSPPWLAAGWQPRTRPPAPTPYELSGVAHPRCGPPNLLSTA